MYLSFFFFFVNLSWIPELQLCQCDASASNFPKCFATSIFKQLQNTDMSSNSANAKIN